MTSISNPRTIASASGLAHEIAAAIDPVFTLIEGWRDQLESALAMVHNRTALIVDADVEGLVVPVLQSTHPLITGAGFVAAPELLSDAPWHLAWWLRSERASGGAGVASFALRRLATVEDPESEQFRDYTTLEWWRVPERTGKRHLTGPYVDYLCTDDYTVTVTTPVLNGAELLGVVGADIQVTRLEHELLSIIRASSRTCTLVNLTGRIVTSTDSHRATGSLLRLPGLVDALHAVRENPETVHSSDTLLVLACGQTSLALVIEG